MWTPVTLASGKTHAYGFGWDISEANGHRLIEHGGAWQGFRTEISRYVDDRLTVIVLTNLDAESSEPERIAHGVAAIYAPDVSLAAAKVIEDLDPADATLLRGTLADLTAGKVDLATFSASEREKWTPARTAGLSEVLKKLGAVEAVKLVKREQEGKLRVSSYVVTFSQAVVMVTLWVDADGKINALRIHE